MLANSVSSTLSHRLNPLLSNDNFRKSCDIVRTRTKPIDLRRLNSILAYDNDQQAFIDDHEHVYIWYFAIGSMINPVSIYLRHLTPLMSYPARCLDHRLVFRTHSGMADIEQCLNDDFHGVVHLLPIEQMFRLDQVEHMYQRLPVTIVDYEQRCHVVHVYQMTSIGNDRQYYCLPTERYLDIIVKGCEYFHVQTSYINRLKHEQAVQPRKSLSNYRTIVDIPDQSYFTIDELVQHDGTDKTLPVWISINGKILEYHRLLSNDIDHDDNHKRFYDFIRSFFAGKEIACIILRTWYEPMYEVPLSDNDLSDEHRAFAEDMCISWSSNGDDNQQDFYWKPIGRLVQTRKLPSSTSISTC
jgi:hypothetical protein